MLVPDVHSPKPYRYSGHGNIGREDLRAFLSLANDVTAGVFDLAVDPDNPKVLYASRYVSASSPATPDAKEKKANSLIYKSTDEGSSWSPLASKGLPEDSRGRLGIVVAPGTQGHRLYAEMNDGFYRSDDAGETWTQSTKDPRIVGNEYFSRIFVDTKNPNILYVAQTSLYRSLDAAARSRLMLAHPRAMTFTCFGLTRIIPTGCCLASTRGRY